MVAHDGQVAVEVRHGKAADQQICDRLGPSTITVFRNGGGLGCRCR
jgi:hypothetical protein